MVLGSHLLLLLLLYDFRWGEKFKISVIGYYPVYCLR